jgi:hypothetical protein
MTKGDLHRFGKQVSFKSNDQMILKPRPTLIEHLFLDKNSPIKKYHNALGIHSYAQIDSLNDWEGFCENLCPYIIKDIEIEKNLEFFFSTAGKLISTSTVLGFNDLHSENILFIKRDNQLAIMPVDLEIIFYKFITSAESCLYPSIKADLDICGLNRLMPFLTVDFLSLLIDHSIETWAKAIEVSPLVQAELRDVPVRMIFRPSKSYALYLRDKDEAVFGNDPIRLTSEERFQLGHGDIPYFFSKYNEPEKILFFDSPETKAQASEVTKHPSTNRHLKGFINSKDKALFYTSTAHLLVNLIKFKNLRFKKIKGSHFEAEITGEQLTISLGNQVIKVMLS